MVNPHILIHGIVQEQQPTRCPQFGRPAGYLTNQLFMLDKVSLFVYDVAICWLVISGVVDQGRSVLFSETMASAYLNLFFVESSEILCS